MHMLWTTVACHPVPRPKPLSWPGDFTWFRMEPIVTGRLIGGFGRIKQARLCCHTPYVH